MNWLSLIDDGRPLVVGCPVRERAWIMPRWFEHMANAVAPVVSKPHLVFVGDPHTDRSTFSTIDDLCLEYSWDRDVVEVAEHHTTVERTWDNDRYQHLVDLRNALLAHVRELDPNFFWSVDSDILVHPESLRSALLNTDIFDAVGSKTYMTPNGTWCPSFAQLNNGGLLRWDAEGCFLVDVIMAIKLMTRAAYAIDYEPHWQGEDIGWSINARGHGLGLGWDGNHASKHVMEPKYLDVVDERCGY